MITTLLHGLYRDREFQPEDERSLVAKIKEKGGTDRVKEHDTVLRELIRYESDIQTAKSKSSLSRNTSRDRRFAKVQFSKYHPVIAERTDAKSNLDILKQDIDEDVKTTVAKNMAVFELKFDFHRRHQEEMFSVMQKLSTGPHERIRDRVSTPR